MSRTGSDWYKASDNEMMGDFKCIKNYESKELELNSKKGFIYPYSDTHYGMVIIKTGAMKKYLPENKRPVKKGDEIFMIFPKEELNDWAKKLGIVNNRSAMVKRANEFGKSVTEQVDNESDSEVESDLPEHEEVSTDSDSAPSESPNPAVL